MLSSQPLKLPRLGSSESMKSDSEVSERKFRIRDRRRNSLTGKSTDSDTKTGSRSKKPFQSFVDELQTAQATDGTKDVVYLNPPTDETAGEHSKCPDSNSVWIIENLQPNVGGVPTSS